MIYVEVDNRVAVLNQLDVKKQDNNVILSDDQSGFYKKIEFTETKERDYVFNYVKDTLKDFVMRVRDCVSIECTKKAKPESDVIGRRG